MDFTNMIENIELGHIYPVIKGLDGLYHKCHSVSFDSASGSNIILRFTYEVVTEDSSIQFYASGTFDQSNSVVNKWIGSSEIIK